MKEIFVVLLKLLSIIRLHVTIQLTSQWNCIFLIYFMFFLRYSYANHHIIIRHKTTCSAHLNCTGFYTPNQPILDTYLFTCNLPQVKGHTGMKQFGQSLVYEGMQMSEVNEETLDDGLVLLNELEKM